MRDSIPVRPSIRLSASLIRFYNPGFALAHKQPKLDPRITDYNLVGFDAGGGALEIASLGTMVSVRKGVRKKNIYHSDHLLIVKYALGE